MILYHHSRSQPLGELQEIQQSPSLGPLTEKPVGLWLAMNKHDWVEHMEFIPKYSYKIELKGKTFEDNGLLVFDFADMEEVLELIERYHTRYRKGYNRVLPRKYWKYRIDWSLVQKDGYQGAAFVNVGKAKWFIMNLLDSDPNELMVFFWIEALDIDSVCLWNPGEIVRRITEFEYKN